MNHIHHKSITSTQDFLIENYAPVKEGTLVTAELQTSGKGQHQKAWTSFEGSLAMSFGLKPANTITLTSLEIPVLVAKYFQEHFLQKIYFKWPNDLINQHQEKCGGIIINRHGNDALAVGLGLNLLPTKQSTDFKFPAGGVFDFQPEFSAKELGYKIYQFILSHRMKDKDIIEQWNLNCIHLNRDVKIIDGEKSIEGIFMGIGNQGQALIQKPNEVLESFSGSLFL